MEAAFQRTAESLRFLPLRIPHTVAVMVMALAFQTEDLDRVGDVLDIYFSQPLPLGRVIGGSPHAEVVRNIGGVHLNFLRRHESSYGKAKGCLITG